MDACQRATVAVTVALPIVASASVAGRFASRHAHKVRLAVDDWTIGFCLVRITPHQSLSLFFNQNVLIVYFADSSYHK